jgi:hypothetical protein
MQLAFVALGSAIALGALALLAALRVAIDARAVGQSNGSWALGFGVEVGPLQLAGVLGTAAPKRLELQLFGRQIALTRLLTGRRKKKAAEADAKSKPEELVKRRRLPSWLDPLDVALFLLDERRHLRPERLELELDYGFRDVALTGKLSGALYVLSAVMPAQVTIKQNPRWDGADTWQVHLDGRLALWPGLVLVEVLWYMFRARFRRRPLRPAVEPVPGTAA